MVRAINYKKAKKELCWGLLSNKKENITVNTMMIVTI